MVDAFPQLLELCLLFVSVQFVLWCLRFASVIYHLFDDTVIEDGLYTSVNSLCNGCKVVLKQRQFTLFEVFTELICDFALLGDISVQAKLNDNLLGIFLSDMHLLSGIGEEVRIFEQVQVGLCGTVVQVLLDFTLKVTDKRSITFGCYHSQLVDIMNLLT